MELIRRKTRLVTLAQRQEIKNFRKIQVTALTKVMRGLPAAMQMHRPQRRVSRKKCRVRGSAKHTQ